jgi:hypothetical protein
MTKLARFFCACTFILLSFSCRLQALAENPTEKFVGRWERSGGAEPMVFHKDGSCQVSLGAAKNGKWTMI